MNINKEQIDELHVVVSVQVGDSDYGDKVNEVLRDYRRKASMSGFRPGKVPEGLIRKMYGKGVLVDEINKIVPEALQNYIKEQEMKLLGEPLPKTKSDDMDWEIGNDFTFDFEMGLTPVIEVNLSKEDRLTKYQIIVEQDIIDQNVENYAKRFGQFVDVSTVVDFNEKLEGNIVQLGEDGQPLQDGLSAEDSSMLLSLVKDEERKKPFENAKVGDEIVFNLSETFQNEWEVASILKKKDKAELGDITALLFRFTVKSIQKHVNAELNQELFDKIFGAGAVTSLEAFENQIRQNVALLYEERSMSKFNSDAQDYFVEKINPQLPEEFLRKWLLSSNNEADEESIEKEIPVLLKKMKWEIILNTISTENDLQVEEQEIINFAKSATQRQLSSYGVGNISNEELNNYTMNYLKDEKSVRTVVSQVLQNKITKTILDTVDVMIQEISFDDFNKMLYASDIEEAGEAGETVETVEAGETGIIETITEVEETHDVIEKE